MINKLALCLVAALSITPTLAAAEGGTQDWIDELLGRYSVGCEHHPHQKIDIVVDDPHWEHTTVVFAPREQIAVVGGTDYHKVLWTPLGDNPQPADVQVDCGETTIRVEIPKGAYLHLEFYLAEGTTVTFHSYKEIVFKY